MRRLRLMAVSALLLSGAAWAGIQVPVDVGVGPAGYWFTGPLLDNRGGIPHFALQLNVHAIIDKELIQANWNRIPPKYRSMAAGVTEVKVGPSIFIPSALIISPRVDALNGVGMFGVSWTPVGVNLVGTGRGSSKDWNRSKGRFDLDAHLLLTYLYIYSDFPAIPPTHFIRPGVQVKMTMLLEASKSFLVSLGAGGQAYVPQRLGEFGIGNLQDSVTFAFFAFLKFHIRFPYDLDL